MSDLTLPELQNEIKTILSRIERPEKMMVTGGMPYANGKLHLGHLAGAHIPSDIFARFYRMFIGPENVLFVCGTDDHGSTSELSAIKAGKEIGHFIEEIHAIQKKTLEEYQVSLDTYTGTSRRETYSHHKELCQETLRKLMSNEMLIPKVSEQWFDPKVEKFLPDRLISGTCPSCHTEGAYSEECDSCGATYEPQELLNPKSMISDGVPELRSTKHWLLDMWQMSDQLKTWIESRSKAWRKFALSEALGTVTPCLKLSKDFEEVFKKIKDDLPKHKSRFAPGKLIIVQFNSLGELAEGKEVLAKAGAESSNYDSWAYRSITRDVSWGVPVPPEIDPTMKDKTFYVWSESLVAPISFTKTAIAEKNLTNQKVEDYWMNPKGKIAQFIGIDNIFFYSVMQGAMWFGTQKDKSRLPIEGELQLTDIYPVYHLNVNDQKMSKSTGNFYTAEELIHDKGYTSDQVRYFLSILSLYKKPSNFDFEMFDDRNKFLSGPMNAAFEKPISAAIKKFNGIVPEGELVPKVAAETKKIIQVYMNSMGKAQYSDLLYLIENYARLINKIFKNFKPHDDRHDQQERQNGLYSSFFILKNLVIMLHPFVPETIDKLRCSLNLPENVYNIDELGKPISAGHKVGELQEFFPHIQEV